MTHITQLTGRKAMSIAQIMTTMLAGFVLVVLQSSTVQAQQWTTTGTNISNTNTGNVGIGTASPSNKLDISTTGTTTTQGIKADANKIAQIAFSHGGTDKWFLSSRGTADAPNNRYSFFFNTGAGFSERMTIDRSGSVGIGMTTPLYSLDVNGGVNGFRAK